MLLILFMSEHGARTPALPRRHAAAAGTWMRCRRARDTRQARGLPGLLLYCHGACTAGCMPASAGQGRPVWEVQAVPQPCQGLLPSPQLGARLWPLVLAREELQAGAGPICQVNTAVAPCKYVLSTNAGVSGSAERCQLPVCSPSAPAPARGGAAAARAGLTALLLRSNAEAMSSHGGRGSLRAQVGAAHDRCKLGGRAAAGQTARLCSRPGWGVSGTHATAHRSAQRTLASAMPDGDAHQEAGSAQRPSGCSDNTWCNHTSDPAAAWGFPPSLGLAPSGPASPPPPCRGSSLRGAALRLVSASVMPMPPRPRHLPSLQLFHSACRRGLCPSLPAWALLPARGRQHYGRL